jgi:hypothetical protein
MPLARATLPVPRQVVRRGLGVPRLATRPARPRVTPLLLPPVALLVLRPVALLVLPPVALPVLLPVALPVLLPVALLVLPPVALPVLLLVALLVMLLVTELESRLVLPPSAFWSSAQRWRAPWRVRWGSARFPWPCRPRHSFEASGCFRLQALDGLWRVQRRARHPHRVPAPISSGASPQSQRARAGEIRR